MFTIGTSRSALGALRALSLAALLVLPALASDPLLAAADDDREGGRSVALLPLDEVLEGKVTSLDKRGVATIEYDFADEAQLRDFEDYRPFRVRGDWERKRRGAGVHLKGTGGIVWKPVFHKT
ncbi:MAG: hypothetical protein ACYTDX_08910, partial [Planctomycetota bacterium]